MKNADSALERLKVIFSRLEVEYLKDEWVMARFSDDYIKTMDPGQAFRFLGLIVEDQGLLNDPSVRTEFLHVILNVARQTDTTEMPTQMSDSWPKLKKGASEAGQYALGVLADIAAYYRMKA